MSKVPGAGDLGGLFRQAQKMQQNLARVQQDLAERVVEASAGGGVVKVQVNGRQEVLSLKIAPEVVEPKEVEMLQDLVLAALNEGLRQSRALAERELGKATGGLGGLPGLF